MSSPSPPNEVHIWNDDSEPFHSGESRAIHSAQHALEGIPKVSDHYQLSPDPPIPESGFSAFVDYSYSKRHGTNRKDRVHVVAITQTIYHRLHAAPAAIYLGKFGHMHETVSRSLALLDFLPASTFLSTSIN